MILLWTNHRPLNFNPILYNPMFSSKIDELRQSTFRDHPSNNSNLFKNKSVLMSSKGRQEEVDERQLNDYQMKAPLCPFHHKPIRYLCLKSDCRSSTFSVCSNEECRQLHADPDSDLIEINKFNQLVRESCSSIQMLRNRMRKYFRQVRDQFVHRMDMQIEKQLMMADRIYTPQVLRTLRDKNYKELDSATLGHFVRKQMNEGPAIRNQLQALRNRVSERIASQTQILDNIFKSPVYDGLMLGDLIQVQQQQTNVKSRVHIKEMESDIVNFKEDVEILMKLLRENRAVAFSKVSLVFRASANHFDSRIMHQNIDGVSPLLFLVKSSMGKRFGAYLNCKLNSREDWIADVSGLSFLFSIDREESYRLKAQAHCRLKAAFGGVKGVQIGSGCDLFLTEDCHLEKKSGANLGGSYRLPGHLQFGTQRSQIHLAGQQHFQVEEFEFFSLE